MSVRSFAHNLFQRLGWDVRRTAYPSSEEVLLTRFLSVARPTVVFDVGANVGQCEGAPTLRRILELCEHLDFQLHGLILGFHNENPGGLLQMDGLFLRNDTS